MDMLCIAIGLLMLCITAADVIIGIVYGEDEWTHRPH
jgi:hypothetical protein